MYAISNLERVPGRLGRCALSGTRPGVTLSFLPTRPIACSYRVMRLSGATFARRRLGTGCSGRLAMPSALLKQTAVGPGMGSRGASARGLHSQCQQRRQAGRLLTQNAAATGSSTASATTQAEKCRATSLAPSSPASRKSFVTAAASSFVGSTTEPEEPAARRAVVARWRSQAHDQEREVAAQVLAAAEEYV